MSASESCNIFGRVRDYRKPRGTKLSRKQSPAALACMKTLYGID